MKREAIDFHLVPERQAAIHERLRVNWRAYCHGGTRHESAPMWRWHQPERGLIYNPPEPKQYADTLDGAKLNRAVVLLPGKHMMALQWYYIQEGSPFQARKRIGVTLDELGRLVIDGRDMLRNRGI
jgi:hypothetical protein